MVEVIWTGPSRNDLAAIREYIGRDSIYYAKICVTKIIAAVERLGTFPDSGRMVPEYQDETVREIIVQPYRVLYRRSDETVYILAVTHSRRRLPDL